MKNVRVGKSIKKAIMCCETLIFFRERKKVKVEKNLDLFHGHCQLWLEVVFSLLALSNTRLERLQAQSLWYDYIQYWNIISFYILERLQAQLFLSGRIIVGQLWSAKKILVYLLYFCSHSGIRALNVRKQNWLQWLLYHMMITYDIILYSWTPKSTTLSIGADHCLS